MKKPSSLKSLENNENVAVYSFVPNDEKKKSDITFIQGDFFSIPNSPFADEDKFNFAFDRGSIVAIKPNLREAYVKAMDHCLAPGARILFTGIEYDQSERPGPPHSISLDELKSLYGSDYEYTLLEENHDSKFLKKYGGPLTKVTDLTVLIVKKA